MELSALRSQLQHACPDLKNLTNADLQECKWLTKKKVFVDLISCSRVLQEQSEALIDLHEERNAESSFMKKEGTSREIRLESESVYRTKFMRIVLSALSRLKWPPSQEAFSDPLDSLFNDRSVFRDAVEFLVNTVVPPDLHIYREVGEETFSAVSPRHKPERRQEHDVDSHANHCDTSMSTVARGENLIEVPVKMNLREGRGDMISSFGYEATNFTPRTPAYADCETQEDPLELISRTKERKQALNWKAFEMLQRQNEMLSVRIRELQLSVLKRDEAELKIAGVISELKATIAEIVDVGSVGVSGKGQLRPGGVGFSEGSVLRDNASSSVGSRDLNRELAQAVMTKEEEMEIYRLEAEREKEELLTRKDKALGISHTVSASAMSHKPPVAFSANKSKMSASARTTVDGDRKTANPLLASPQYCSKCSGAMGLADKTPLPSAGVIWSKLHGRLSALEAQWSAAQRAAHSLAERQSERLSHLKSSPQAGSPPPRIGKSSATPVSGVLYSAQSTPSRSLVSKAYGVQPALWSSTAESSFSVGDGLFGSNYNSPPLPPSRPSHHDPFEQQSGLDLSRVHLLQRDLVAFSERAFAWCSESLFVAPGVGGANASQHPDALPLSDRAARRQQEALDLQLASCDLLMHLSAVSPFVPLALDSPLQSSMAGLEVLLLETAELAYPKVSKQTQIRLQTAGDRALAEQVAAIRCWRQTRACLSQWTAHAARVAPTLKMLGRRHKSNVERAADDLSALSGGLSRIFEALGAAEAVRIRPSGDDVSLVSSASSHSMRSGTTISPLDSLSRGSAGKEIAALVNALRAHREEVGEAAEIVRVLGVKLGMELKRDLEVVGSTEKNILFAADLSENVLETTLPKPVARKQGVTRPGGEDARVADGSVRRGGGRPKRSQQADGAGGKSSTLSDRPAFDLSLS